MGGGDGEQAKNSRAFEQSDQQHFASPGGAKNLSGLLHKAGPRRWGWTGSSDLFFFAPQQHRHTGKQRRHGHKSPAPAQVVGDQAAQPLPRRDAQHGAQAHPGQGFLPLCIGHLVAHPGQGQRHDGRRGHRSQDTGHDQLIQILAQGGQDCANAAAQGGDHHHAVFAPAVSQRAVNQLHQPVGHGVKRNHMAHHGQRRIEDPG